MQRHSIICLLLPFGFLCSAAAGFAQVFFDRGQWEQQLTSSTTIDFTGWAGFPFGPVITDQYSHLGVIFIDGNDRILNDKDPSNPDTFPNDGSGLHSGFNNEINLVFDTTQFGLAMDSIGLVVIELYHENKLVFTSNIYGAGIGHPFAGLVYADGFDRVKLRTPFIGHLTIDDLHFGVPGPGALGVFGLAALFGGSRRRRP